LPRKNATALIRPDLHLTVVRLGTLNGRFRFFRMAFDPVIFGLPEEKFHRPIHQIGRNFTGSPHSGNELGPANRNPLFASLDAHPDAVACHFHADRGRNPIKHELPTHTGITAQFLGHSPPIRKIPYYGASQGLAQQAFQAIRWLESRIKRLPVLPGESGLKRRIHIGERSRGE